MKQLAGILIFMASCGVSRAQTEDSLLISKIADEVLVSGKVYDNLRVLCKSVGGRLSGSPQMYKAEQWGAATLQAAGADKVYLQQCMVPHWVRGNRDQAWYSYTDSRGKPVREKLDVLALGNSMGTGSKGLQAPVILIHNFTELETLKDKIKGKIVFYNYPFNERYVQTFRAYGEAGVYRHAGASKAARYGAVGMVLRSMTSAVDNNPHTGAMGYDSLYPKIPAAAMGARDADKLAKTLEAGTAVELFYQSAARMLADTVGHNVIGEFRGSEFPDQYITIGGHLDSWDPAEGANDDGAGIVQSIEVLRALKAIGYRPRHTIRIVLFANEENGLRGGTEYARVAREKNEKHVFALESDAGGFTPRGFSISLKGERLERIQPWLNLLKPYGVYEFYPGGGGADVGPVSEAFSIPASELIPDSQRYFDVHHARSDVLENVNKRELELGALNMAALIYLVDKYGL